MIWRNQSLKLSWSTSIDFYTCTHAQTVKLNNLITKTVFEFETEIYIFVNPALFFYLEELLCPELEDVVYLLLAKVRLPAHIRLYNQMGQHHLLLRYLGYSLLNCIPRRKILFLNRKNCSKKTFKKSNTTFMKPLNRVSPSADTLPKRICFCFDWQKYIKGSPPYIQYR